MSYFLKSLYKLFSNWSNLGHKSQVYFNHKQAVRAFHIDTIHNKPVGLAEGLSCRLNLIYGVIIESKNGISCTGRGCLISEWEAVSGPPDGCGGFQPLSQGDNPP